jgi:hypothetical protein
VDLLHVLRTDAADVFNILLAWQMTAQTNLKFHFFPMPKKQKRALREIA